MIRLTPLLLLIMLLYGGCDDTQVINTPLGRIPGEEPLNYYPMSVGNRWVYRTPDGSELEHTITRKEAIGGFNYYVFNYEPPINDWGFTFLQNPKHAAATDSVILSITEADLNQVPEQVFNKGVVPWLRADKPQLAKRREPLLFKLPFIPGQQWLALDIRLTGSYDASYYFYAYEARGMIAGRVADFWNQVKTPAGTFEDCIKVQYTPDYSMKTTEFTTVETVQPEDIRRSAEVGARKSTSVFFSYLLPRLKFETVWLAPNVGPVIIETFDGIAELIDYDIKPAQ